MNDSSYVWAYTVPVPSRTRTCTHTHVNAHALGGPFFPGWDGPNMVHEIGAHFPTCMVHFPTFWELCTAQYVLALERAPQIGNWAELLAVFLIGSIIGYSPPERYHACRLLMTGVESGVSGPGNSTLNTRVLGAGANPRPAGLQETLGTTRTGT